MDPTKKQTPPTATTTAMREKEKTKRTLEDPFEFCDVCRLNHDQGRRHKYFPSHVRSLSSLLSRFQKKIAEIQSFLRNPSILGPDHSHLDSVWCVFCGVDVVELGSSFTCGNAIYHLASAEHIRNLKDFLRKHGGMDRVDSFRVSDANLIKWEKGCESLKSATSTSSKGASGLLSVLSKDIQHELTSKNMDNFDNHSICSFNSNAYHAVMPLQSLTNEGYRVYPQELNGATGGGSVPYDAASLSVGLQGNIGGMHAMQNVTSFTGKQSMQLGNNGKFLVGGSLTNGMFWKDSRPNPSHSNTTIHHPNTRSIPLKEGQSGSGGDCTRALQKFTQISSAVGGPQANVHTGALPPWLDASEGMGTSQLNTGPHLNKLTISPAQTGKSKKLNPKRVGAAWAEKRRVELKMEKRGERVSNTVDANWLPNFGRVWQTGTRKESRKEFEMEKREVPKDDNHPELSFKIQPYISKRMRTGSPNKDSALSG